MFVGKKPAAASSDAGKAEYPPDHLAAMPVPKGGSSCASCEYLADDKKSCTSEYFIRWQGPNKPAGSATIPGEIDAYCSDWYESQEGAL